MFSRGKKPIVAILWPWLARGFGTLAVHRGGPNKQEHLN